MKFDASDCLPILNFEHEWIHFILGTLEKESKIWD